MRLLTITFLFLTSVISSCQINSKYVAQLNTTETLIKAMYNNDTLKVGDLIGVNPERIGEDIEHFEFKVLGTTKMLQEYGMPKKSSYKSKRVSRRKC